MSHQCPVPVLATRQPHLCAVKNAQAFGTAKSVCDTCKNGDDKSETPGCFLRRQKDHLFGWSESNVQYELLGCVKEGT